MNITCVGVREEEKVFFEQELPTAKLLAEKLDSSMLSTIRDTEILCVFVDSLVTKEVIDALPHLQLITTRSTGLDHVDTAYATSKGITVTNVPGYGKRSVAEFALALLLTLSRKIFDAYHQIRFNGDYSFKHLRGFDLGGKTLGIVGTGQIGRHLAQIARGLEMTVLAYDVQPDPTIATALGFTYVDFDTLLSGADIISLHVPLTDATRHLLNRDTLAKTKSGVYIINTARGELIDTTALIEALNSGQVAGAGLDVLEGESELKDEVELISGGQQMADVQVMLENHILTDMPQVVVTPHIAFYSKEAEREIVQTSISNIKSFMKATPANKAQAL